MAIVLMGMGMASCDQDSAMEDTQALYEEVDSGDGGQNEPPRRQDD